MRCLSCYYDLRNLSTEGEHRCPECGREFDPADPRTWTHRIGPVPVILLVAKTILLSLGLFICFLIAIALVAFIWHELVSW